MREILFRGKRIDSGEWIFGMPWIFKEKSCICPWKKGMCKYDTGFFPVEVIPETVGQYTGLKDQNGKRIFEGDILHVVSPEYEYDFNTSVGARGGYTSGFYVDGAFGDGDFNEIGFAFDYWEEEDAEVEIIGNVHDNPRLLEVENAER